MAKNLKSQITKLKTLTSFVVAMCICASAYTQIDTTQHIVTIEADGVRTIVVADIDGDSFKDVISANKFGSNVSWFKNDGNGNFGPQQIIATLQETIFVSVVDLDNDTDMDVLAVSGPLDQVVWYENLDGMGAFGPQNVLSSTSDGAYSVIAADIDGDNDLDPVWASDDSDRIVWSENLGGGNFGSEQIIANGGNSGRRMALADFDGDNDIDIAVTYAGTTSLLWYENLDGLGNFGPAIPITPPGLATNDVFASDLDGDNDIDLLVVGPAADRITWYENLDGLGNFSSEIIITDQGDGVRTVFAADLDNDNDMDVIAGAGGAFDGLLTWFENTDGQGTFGPAQIILDSTDHMLIRDVFAEDVDGDGDMDVFAASQNDDKIVWYENLIILGVPDNTQTNFLVYPNPATNTLFIHGFSSETVLYTIYGVNGSSYLYGTYKAEGIDVSGLSEGLYFMTVEGDSSIQTKKFIKN